jgi:hypothetical protein
LKRILEVRDIETLGEPAVNLGQHRTRLSTLALPVEQSREVRCGERSARVIAMP